MNCCAYCGALFRPRMVSKGNGRHRLSERRTCSDECLVELKAAQNRAIAAAVKKNPIEPIEIRRNCLVCGNEYRFLQDPRRNVSQRRTCSHDCEVKLKAQTTQNKHMSQLEREQQIAAAVRSPQIEQLRQQLAFYEKRGVSGQVRLLAQKIQELGGKL